MTTTVESAVRERYSETAKAPEAALCCPVEYDPQYLQIIPEEIIAKDYGCGDPSQHAREGEVVVDLGLGGGKSCCIASKIVGVEGRVIGVDMNDEMLALARKYQPEIIAEIGRDNVEFSKGRIQDLRLDRDRLDAWLRDNPVTDELLLRRMEEAVARFKQEQP